MPSSTISLVIYRPHFSIVLQGSTDVAILPAPLTPIVLVGHPNTPSPLSEPSSGSTDAVSLPVEANKEYPTLNLGKLVLILDVCPRFSEVSKFVGCDGIACRERHS